VTLVYSCQICMGECVCISVCEGVGCAQWKVNSVHVTFVVFPTFTNQGTGTSDDERTVNILISLTLFSLSLFLCLSVFLSFFSSHSFPFQGICLSVSALCGLRSHDSDDRPCMGGD